MPKYRVKMDMTLDLPEFPQWDPTAVFWAGLVLAIEHEKIDGPAGMDPGARVEVSEVTRPRRRALLGEGG